MAWPSDPSVQQREKRREQVARVGKRRGMRGRRAADPGQPGGLGHVRRGDARPSFAEHLEAPDHPPTVTPGLCDADTVLEFTAFASGLPEAQEIGVDCCRAWRNQENKGFCGRRARPSVGATSAVGAGPFF